jgi:cytochrome c
VWNEKTLDRFLTKPLAMVPGSSMTYDGVPEARDRGDLIAYLQSANRSAACRIKP